MLNFIENFRYFVWKAFVLRKMCGKILSINISLRKSMLKPLNASHEFFCNNQKSFSSGTSISSLLPSFLFPIPFECWYIFEQLTVWICTFCLYYYRMRKSVVSSESHWVSILSGGQGNDEVKYFLNPKINDWLIQRFKMATEIQRELNAVLQLLKNEIVECEMLKAQLLY